MRQSLGGSWVKTATAWGWAMDCMHVHARLAGTLFVLFAAVACTAEGGSPTATPFPVPADLLQVVAHTAIDRLSVGAEQGEACPEGAVLAYVTTTRAAEGRTRALEVWRCVEGTLAEADETVFEQAVGADASRWPSYTFYFTFEFISLDDATFSVCALYDRLSTEETREGSAARLGLERLGDEWAAVTWDEYGGCDDH